MSIVNVLRLTTLRRLEGSRGTGVITIYDKEVHKREQFETLSDARLVESNCFHKFQMD